MPIEIQGSRVPGLTRAALRTRLGQVLKAEAHTAHLPELSILLTDDVAIAGLHERWMGIKGPTDVLSFSQDSADAECGPGALLGDVVVSLDTAARQAAEHCHSVAVEALLLGVHGTLHLLGYNDLTDADRLVMRRKEREYVPEAFSGGETCP